MFKMYIKISIRLRHDDQRKVVDIDLIQQLKKKKKTI